MFLSIFLEKLINELFGFLRFTPKSWTFHLPVRSHKNVFFVRSCSVATRIFFSKNKWVGQNVPPPPPRCQYFIPVSSRREELPWNPSFPFGNAKTQQKKRLARCLFLSLYKTRCQINVYSYRGNVMRKRNAARNLQSVLGECTPGCTHGSILE